MNILETTINDVKLIKPNVYEDERGYFMESFKNNWFEEHFKNIKFVQTNESKSRKGVLRGLHFQSKPYAQTKLVRVVQGTALDVVVDLRKESSTFGKHESFELSDQNKLQLFIPIGLAHGFIVLSESAIFSYHVDQIYMPDYESGLKYNDKNLNIDWHLNPKEISLSEKDKNLPDLEVLMNCNQLF